MAVSIRLAEKHDREGLGRLGAMLMQIHFAFDRKRFLEPGAEVESGYGAFLGSVIGSDDGVVFVAEDGGRLVGYVYASLEPMSWKELRGPAGFIHDLAVDEASRRVGVATGLLQRATAWLRERGAPRVMLWTAAPNKAAQALFRDAGFRETMVEMTLEL